jgi:putative ABC transport system permease protein
VDIVASCSGTAVARRNDWAKFIMLLVGIIFSVFLMIMMLSMFAEVLNRAFSTVINIGAKIWVMDPAVNKHHTAVSYPSGTLANVPDVIPVTRSEDSSHRT